MAGHTEGVVPEFHGATRRLLHVTQGFALVGGALFVAVVVLSVVSIVGRKLWSAPINGDLELLQMGTGIAAATFFPYCTMMGEHLRVEFFTARCSPRTTALLDAGANFLLAIALGLLTWRTSSQVQEVYLAGEVTVMRNIPVWIPEACLVPSLALTVLAALNRFFHHLSVRGAAR